MHISKKNYILKMKACFLEKWKQLIIFFKKLQLANKYCCHMTQPITELESESSFMIGRPATNSYNIIVFFYQKDDITIRFTLSGSSDITGHNNVYFLIYFFVYLE